MIEQPADGPLSAGVSPGSLRVTQKERDRAT